MIVPRIFQSFQHIRAAVSTRGNVAAAQPFGMNMSYTVGDDPAKVAQSREEFFASLGIDRTMLAIPAQIHSTITKIIDTPSTYPDCDGLITQTKNIALAVTIADCLPVLLFDPQHDVIAAVHAGWRGTVSHMVLNAVQQLIINFQSDPKELLAFIGPGAGACCYEIGEDVASQFQNQHITFCDGKKFLDLKKINFHQLLEIGLQKQHIEVCQHCTICEPVLFHSYRRDRDRSGRMMATITMRKNKKREI
jgi:polyphenol oxidase